MRIDPNPGPQIAEANSNPSESSASASQTAANQMAGEDHTELSTSGAQVQELVAQASRLPEIRQERVQSLRQAIQSGQYQSSPEQVAGAMFEHMMTGTAA